MSAETRTIAVDYLARVEGEGSLTLVIEDGRAKEARLSIFEPPRFFEAFLRGRGYAEAPDITSRICGICPVAYITSACRAMEDALGIELGPELRALRRLLYCGEWIESHALHVFLLHAPDFLGYPDAVAMARDHRDWVAKGLAIKKAGNAIVALLGGREIHPVNTRVGGFYSAPSRADLEGLLPELRAGSERTRACLSWMATLPCPELDRPYEFVALRSDDVYAITEGRLVSSGGLGIEVRDYDAHFIEEHVSWSTALRSRIHGSGSYLCGPLARFNLSFDRLLPEVQDAARAAGLAVPCRNPFRSLLVRLVEILQAFEESIRIIEAYAPPPAPFVAPPALRAGTGYGGSEAPRGFLYHRYTLDAEGTILDAKIVPPTSQNQLSIEEDLCAMSPSLASLPLREATARAEQAVRNHDPCISCATHFLTLRVEEAPR
ncbi:Ni/Fe hydrogenase subunit alpha [Sorangium atrum]|uniref:Nickel-dependent hydrogenase large subunit n=1 Tax=Sorangium atrum TaxID=2995308 RepID=A0ABT5CG95_9BACT|nr:nickel-dependent hydrogenase large subunit [Sorangium aterium]MDC0685441.1 nickel-dependent hydrogenase large subunit [Sorangium aterium]